MHAEPVANLALRLGCRWLNSVDQLANQSSTIIRSSLIQLSRFSAASGGDAQNVLLAQPREDSGSTLAHKLRKSGRTPGIIFSLPKEESMLVSFDAKSLSNTVHRIGRTGWACQVFDVQIQDPSSGETINTIRTLGRQVHVTADTDAIENVTLMHCPPERTVKVKVPLQVFGEEVCPGIKAGGRINWIQRTIACTTKGDSIPKAFEVDISNLVMNDKVLYSALDVPEGVQLVQKDLDEPILKIRK